MMIRCAECDGIVWVTYGSHSTDSEPCRTCAGRGRIDPKPASATTEEVDHG